LRNLRVFYKLFIFSKLSFHSVIPVPVFTRINYNGNPCLAGRQAEIKRSGFLLSQE